MKISPVNSNYNSFKGIISANQFVPKKLFAEKEDMIRTLSDAKKVDIWAFAQSSGAYINPNVHYYVMIKDKNSNLVKNLEADDKQEQIDDLTSKVEESLILYDAPANVSVIDQVANSPAAQENPEYAQQISERLFHAGMSSESRLWETKIKML